MKTSRMSLVIGATASLALGLFGLSNAVCRAQTPAPGTPDSQAAAMNLPPGASDVLKLSKAGLSEEIILGQVKGMGPVSLTTDQIIYLSSNGVSQNVIKALIQNAPAAS